MGDVHLQFFAEMPDALDRLCKAKVSRPIDVRALEGGLYLRQEGAPSIEPTFLCTDGRWRRYDLVPELPHSSAAPKPVQQAVDGSQTGV